MKGKAIFFTFVIVFLVLMMTMCVFGAKKKIVVGFSQVGAESAWRTANTQSIISEARKRGVDLKFVDAQQNEENQIKDIRSFIAQNVNVIGFSPVAVTGWDSVLQEAKKANIPVIVTERAVDVKDTSLYITFMGSDFVLEGQRAAQFLIDKGYKGNIVEMEGTVGSVSAIDLKKGFDGIINKHSEYKILASVSGDLTRLNGKEVMEAFLTTHGKNINIVFAHNDDMALGAIQAIEEYGLKPGKDIIIVSIGAIHDAFVAMTEGKLNCAVEFNPLLGPQFFDAVEVILAGKTLPKRIITKEGVFPMEVAKEVLPTRKY